MITTSSSKELFEYYQKHLPSICEFLNTNEVLNLQTPIISPKFIKKDLLDNMRKDIESYPLFLRALHTHHQSILKYIREEFGEVPLIKVLL